ncbi:hypothetical protein ANRL4_02428 [Anaerolineae bacterium]|nr:hypothetical protein ANRL4_02428 [Anaerolineae bacterium]
MGILYLMKSGSFYKIGKTRDEATLQRRLAAISTASPLPVTLDHTIVLPGNEEDFLETYLHEKFASARHNGEWFHLQPDHVQYIRSIQGAVPQVAQSKLPSRRIFRLPRWRRRWKPPFGRSVLLDALILGGIVYLYRNPDSLRRLNLPRLSEVEQVILWLVAWWWLLRTFRRYTQ